MTHTYESMSNAEKAVAIVRDAGGMISGYTKLQKTAYLLELAGVGCGFHFENRSCGPFSEELAEALEDAQFTGMLLVEECRTGAGGVFSVYRTPEGTANEPVDEVRRQILEKATSTNPITLELAAMAAYLATEHSQDPWAETVRRAPQKAVERRLKDARTLLFTLRSIPTPAPLPAF